MKVNQTSKGLLATLTGTEMVFKMISTVRDSVDEEMHGNIERGSIGFDRMNNAEQIL